MSTLGGILGVQVGLLAPMTAFTLFGLGTLICGTAALAISAIGFVRARSSGTGADRQRAGMAAGVGAALLAVILIAGSMGEDVPPINDITTDLADPPAFAPADSVPAYADRDMGYPPEFADQVRAGYPDLRPLTSDLGTQDAYALALDSARELGWEITCAMGDGPALWDSLWAAGEEFDVAPIGAGVYGTSGRLEKGYRLMGAELESEYNPAEAGLSRVSVSLDSLDDETFMAMNDVGYPATKVLAGIDAAAAAGLTPVKVNVVVKRGVNDQDVLPMAEHFRSTGHIVRYIEYMDVGVTNGWRLDDVVPAAEIIETINAVHPLEPVDPHYPGEVARRYLYKDGSGEVGVISSVSQPFCGTCSRARISAEGKLYTCLFATAGTDLRGPLRAGYTDEQLESLIRGVWTVRGDRYSEVRSEATLNLPKVEMSYIGG